MLLSIKVNIPLQIFTLQSLSKYYFFSQWENWGKKKFPINTLFSINGITLYCLAFSPPL